MSAQCPQCGSGSLQRVKRRILTRLLWSDSKKFSCRDCGHQFLLKADSKEQQVSPQR